MIPVSVIVVTKNEAARIGNCLQHLRDFDEVIVVDSGSADGTKEIALAAGAVVHDFAWNGLYPKKRQWCLDNIFINNKFVFFVDADEVVTPELINEIKSLDFCCAGYFVRGRYSLKGRLLRFGLRNNKLALFDRSIMEFPVVDDIGLPGMGEIEGHYQPVLKVGCKGSIGQLREVLLHHAYEDETGWAARHRRYAQWEAGMHARGAWPQENSAARRWLKAVFRALPFRPAAAFVHCYVLKLGFLDGAAGFRFARSRAAYYRMISQASKEAATGGGHSIPRPARS